jgi:cobalt/nickel transport system permease protein
MSRELLTTETSVRHWLAERDPRLRILAALAFAAVTVSLHSLPVLLLVLGTALGMALAAGLPARRALRRLLALEGFMLVLLTLLPFSVPGTPWLTLGPLHASQEGLLLAAQILLRVHAIVIMLLTLVGTLEPATLGHALGRLRVPDKLVHLFLFTVRYVDVLDAEFLRLRQAMRARAFVPGSNAHSWRSLGWLIGMLLVRSLERSQRILAAMKCRGFDGRLYLLEDYRWRRADSLHALGFGLLLAAILLLEVSQ